MKNNFDVFVSPGFLSKDEARAANDYCLFLYNNKRLRRERRGEKTASWAVYSDLLLESLLERVNPVVSKLVGTEVSPSFSFLNHYRKGDQLAPHKDRCASEIGVSVCLGSSTNSPWPLYVLTDTGPFRAVADLGDAIFFRGRDFYHWRKPLQQEYHTIANLFYVANTPSNNHLVFDGREKLGMGSTLLTA